MGDAADDAYNFAMNRQIGHNYRQVTSRAIASLSAERYWEMGYWVTQDRRPIRFGDMTDGHLSNAIRYCENHPDVLVSEGLPYLRAEKKRRDDLAATKRTAP